MPLALLIAGGGDARDAVGLFLAGLGWTTVPTGPSPGGVAAEIAAVDPLLVAVDFRGDPEAALECAQAAAAGDGERDVVLLNVPEAYAGRVAALAPAVRVASAPGDVPRAPGVPGPPH